MAKIIDFLKYKTTRPKPTRAKLKNNNEMSCHNCGHFKIYKEHGVIVTGMIRKNCGHFPGGDIHSVTTNACTLEDRHFYWTPKLGLFRRFLNILF